MLLLNEWQCPDHVFADFRLEDDETVGINILVGSYTYEAYSGDAVVIFERYGKLYFVEGSHCSCYGLEGQWEPEETSLEALKRMQWEDHGLTVSDIEDALMGIILQTNLH